MSAPEPKRQRLTPTQSVLLHFALTGPIKMVNPDRNGTRCIGYEDGTGVALMVAYGTPEVFLVSRGLLRKGSRPYTYEITDAGREAVTKARVP